jgi:hypothetical protein
MLAQRARMLARFARTVCSPSARMFSPPARRDSGLELDARPAASGLACWLVFDSNCMLAQRARMFSPPARRDSGLEPSFVGVVSLAAALLRLVCWGASLRLGLVGSTSVQRTLCRGLAPMDEWTQRPFLAAHTWGGRAAH